MSQSILDRTILYVAIPCKAVTIVHAWNTEKVIGDAEQYTDEYMTDGFIFLNPGEEFENVSGEINRNTVCLEERYFLFAVNLGKECCSIVGENVSSNIALKLPKNTQLLTSLVAGEDAVNKRYFVRNVFADGAKTNAERQEHDIVRISSFGYVEFCRLFETIVGELEDRRFREVFRDWVTPKKHSLGRFDFAFERFLQSRFLPKSGVSLVL